MSYAERLMIADRIGVAKQQHKKRAELIRELRDLTTKQIRREIRWGWLRKYKPSERTMQVIGLAIGSVIYVGALAIQAWMGMPR